MAERTAQNFMAVAARFPKSATVADFSPKVLCALAAPSTPDEVVTLAEVQRLKADLAAEKRRSGEAAIAAVEEVDLGQIRLKSEEFRLRFSTKP